MKHDCQPNPIDTDYMELVHDMVRLSEQIARMYTIWAGLVCFAINKL